MQCAASPSSGAAAPATRSARSSPTTVRPRALYRALVSGVAGEPVFLDVPESNPAAIALAVEHDMKSVFETARMYNTRAAPDPLDRVFGVTTFELG